MQPGIMMHHDPEDDNRSAWQTPVGISIRSTRQPGETGKQRKTVNLPGEIPKYIQGKLRTWTVPYAVT